MDRLVLSGGGCRQQLAAFAEQRERKRKRSVRKTIPSLLVRLLLCCWAWGDMSPQLMQKIAHAAAKDMKAYKED